MRRLGLLVLLVGRSALAEAPGETPLDPYSVCLDRRHDIYTDASTIDDVEIRSRMLRLMPTCSPGMHDDGTIVKAADEANALAATAKVPTSEHQWRWSVTTQPAAVLRHTFLFGVEFSPVRHLAVSVHGGVGRTEHVQVGSTYHWYYTDGTDEWRVLEFTEKQIGAQASYYVQGVMKGAHVAVDATYQHFGDSTEADRVTNPWISVEGFSMAALAGYKTVSKQGFTLQLQMGPMFTATRTDNKLMLNTDWSFDKSVHLYWRFAGGWSF